MARIRSIKPSFWTDARVVSLSRDARLLCLGMISHADDEGRLFASVARLAGDVFPADNLRASVVAAWRGEVVAAGVIELYVVGGVEYARFPRWERHQRISRPTASTLPDPPQQDPEPPPTPHPPAESLRTSSVSDSALAPRIPAEPLRTSSLPSRAGGRRQETGDRSPSYDGAQTVQVLVAEWIDELGNRPPGAVVGQVAKLLGQMVAEGIPPADCRRGLATWQGKGLHPSALPSVVHEIRTPRTPAKSTTTERVNQGLALVEHYRRLEEGA